MNKQNIFSRNGRGLCKSLVLGLALSTLLATAATAQEKPKSPPTKSPDGPQDEVQQLAAGVENDYYQFGRVNLPAGIEPEVGGLTVLPDNRLAVATRKGDVYIIENAEGADQKPASVRHFARGLHEPLGLAYRDGALYCAQRGSLTKLIDTNGDQVADVYENVYTIPISGNYHEYAFGPKFDKEGNAYITLNVGFTNPDWWIGKSLAPWRGWALKIAPDGSMTPWATGLRSPAGLGIVDGELFYTENQGDWVGSGGITHLPKGAIAHNPAGLKWSSMANSPTKVLPDAIKDDGVPLFEHALTVPGLQQPAAWLPHGILGGSTADVLPDSTGGAFGPFKGQLFIGDQNQASISRVSLEKVKGVYQGAAFPFRKGFNSGVLRMAWDSKGTMYVGSTDRGWKSHGPMTWGLQRLTWTGKVPFEMLDIKAKADGFEVKLTQPADKQLAAELSTWTVSSFIYKHHAKYGSPVINVKELPVRLAKVSDDGMSIRLVVDSLREGYIHQINAGGLKSASGLPLLHTDGFYTLFHIPDGDKLPVPVAVAKPVVPDSKPAAVKEKPATKTAAPTVKAAAKTIAANTSAASAKPTPQLLAQGKKLYEYNGCTTCHPAGQQGLGPGVNMIAAKYRSDAKALERLTTKVLNGGSGVWGNEPMPAQKEVGKENIQKILTWMLNQ